MRTFETDLAWSQKCIRIASPQIKTLFSQIPNLFGTTKMLIYPVEGIKSKIFEILDKNCGIDYFISNESGDKVVSFSWRAINSTAKRCREEGVYNAFSLREKRNTKYSKQVNCEIAKRIYSIENKLISPLFIVEAYFIDDILLSIAIARTEDVIDAYLKCPIRICDPNNKEKEVFFYDVSWEIMKNNGYPVYDWYLNEKCKRTYKLNEYQQRK